MTKLSCFLSFFLLGSLTLLAVQPKSAPTGLMVDFLRDPSRGTVNKPFPNFTWIVNGSGIDSQKSYQIKVSSARKKLEAGDGDIWNSGQVYSQQSVNVKYAGLPLKPSTSYFWNVTTVNDRSKSHLTSNTQEFKTGTFETGAGSSVMPLVRHSISPLKVVTKNSFGNYFADFGKAAFGTLRVQIESQHSDSIIIHLGEKLEAPGIVKRNPRGTIRYRFIVLHIKKGTQMYTLNIPPFARHLKYPAIPMPADVGEVTPFRYCEIETISSSVVCKSVEQVAVNYFWDDSESSFSCSDSILYQVWDLCKYSIKATSFCGVYVDGDRERIPYEADAYINQLGHYCTDREYSMARYSHEYLLKNPTWPTEWIMHSVMMAYADYMYTGDAESLTKFYKDLKNKSLISLERDDGLISTRTGLMNETVLQSIYIHGPLKDIVDWPSNERDGNEMPDVSTVVNAFHYNSLKLLERIAVATGNGADELVFREKSEKLKQVFNSVFFDRTGNKYLDGERSSHASLHASIFPLAFGLVPEALIPGVAKYIRSKGMACSVYAAQYLLEALYAAGEDKVALDLMTSIGDRGWYNMIRSGSSVTMEAWDAKYKPNLDWNHAWGAVPANMVARGLWGILPLTPGFALAQIRPQTGGLTQSKIKVPTIRGSINCGFKTDNTTRFDLQVNIPVNMKAVVSVPVRGINNPALFVNNKKVMGKREGKYFIAETGGGETSFSVREGGK